MRNESLNLPLSLTAVTPGAARHSASLGVSPICRRRGPVLVLHRLLENLEAACEVPGPTFDSDKTFIQ